MNKEKFIQALENNSLSELQSIPKSDLHNHAGRGSSISYIEQWANVRISPPTTPFDSLMGMNKWLNDNIKCHFPDGSGYLKRVEGAFAQAKTDNLSVLALSFAMDEVYLFGEADRFINTMNTLHRTFAPDTLFLPDLAVGHSLTEQDKLDEIFSKNWFKGIDIINYLNVYSMTDLQNICKKARESKLILKAHIGEFGQPDDVMRYAEELELNQIQHGIAAAESPQIMKWLAKHKVQLNVCPTSNILLKNTKDYLSHQIRTLFDFGVPVTINTDDLVIFNASASQEYLNLYNSGLMTAEELNTIRETGLASANS